MTLPLAAVRRRSTVTVELPIEATLTLVLMHTLLNDPVRFLNAKSGTDVSWLRALGGATPPVALSIERFVTPDQFANPAVKSSLKITGGPEATVIGWEVPLRGPRLVPSNASTA